MVNQTDIDGTCSLCINSIMHCPAGTKKVGQKKANCFTSSRPVSITSKYFLIKTSIKPALNICFRSNFRQYIKCRKR